MKFSLLALLCVTLAMVLATLTNVMRFLGHSFSPMISALLLVSVGMHPETVQSILWISNGNELLMVFFYIIAAYLISAVISGKKEPGYGIMVATVFAYMLSILTKQQSLHLPLVIFLFLWIYRKSISADVRRYLRTTSAIMLIAMIIVLAINAELFINRDVTGSLLSSWWKKPFAMAGTVIYLLFPFYGWKLYSLFLNNVVFTMVVSCFAATVIISYIHLRRISVNNLLYFCAICILVFIPRLSMPAGDRINVVLVFTILPLIFVVVGKTNTIWRFVLIVVSVGIIYSGYDAVLSFNKAIDYFTKSNKELIQYRYRNDNEQIMLAYTNPLMPTQHSLYYFKHAQLGVDSTFMTPGIILRNNFSWSNIPHSATIHAYGDTITFNRYSIDDHFDIDPKHRNNIKIVDSLRASRGHSYIKATITNGIIHPSKILIYTDSGWVSLSQ
jgi:hypothetical protein